MVLSTGVVEFFSNSHIQMEWFLSNFYMVIKCMFSAFGMVGGCIYGGKICGRTLSIAA